MRSDESATTILMEGRTRTPPRCLSFGKALGGKDNMSPEIQSAAKVDNVNRSSSEIEYRTIKEAEEERFTTSHLGVGIIHNQIKRLLKESSDGLECIKHNIREVAKLTYIDPDAQVQEFDAFIKSIKPGKQISNKDIKWYIEILDMRCVVAPTIRTIDAVSKFREMNKGATFRGVAFKPGVLEKIGMKKPIFKG